MFEDVRIKTFLEFYNNAFIIKSFYFPKQIKTMLKDVKIEHFASSQSVHSAWRHFIF